MSRIAVSVIQNTASDSFIMTPSRIVKFDGEDAFLVEWHLPECYVEVEITEDGRYEWMRRDQNGKYIHWETDKLYGSYHK